MRGATNHYTGPSAQGPRNRAFRDIPPAPGDANAAFAALMGILFRALWRLITSPFRLAARAFALISRRSP